MRRLLGLALAVSLVLGSFGAAEGAVVRGRWSYGSSWIQSYDPTPLGLWKVVTYYDVRLNGITVQLTAPMRCIVLYAIAYSIDITYCGLDTVYVYIRYPSHGLTPAHGVWVKRWRVTTHWRTCFLTICADHGHTYTFNAYGYTTDRSQW